MPPPTIAKLSLRGIGVIIALAIITVLAVALTVQTVRLDGLKIWPFEITGWKPRVEQLGGDLARMTAAQALADEAARQQKEQAEREYAALSERIDDDVQTELGKGIASADRFISAGGVWPKAADCPSGGAFAAAQNHSAANPVGAGGAAQLDGAETQRTGGAGTPDPAALTRVVGVLANDVRVCTVNTVKAEGGHDLAVGLDALNRQNHKVE